MKEISVRLFRGLANPKGTEAPGDSDWSLAWPEPKGTGPTQAAKEDEGEVEGRIGETRAGTGVGAK